MIFPLVIIGKLLALMSRTFNFGSGGTWPGEIALRIYPAIFSYFIDQLKKGLILIAGTNGKTTTAKMISQILAKSGNDSIGIVHNNSGANLLNGLVSAFISKSSLFGKLDIDFAIFEVDEAALPIVLAQLTTFRKRLVIVLLDLFRDQLDRYGEVDLIASKWQQALASLPKEATIILNADDPQIAYLGKSVKCRVEYFGIDKPDKFLPKIEHATDSIYCRKCGNKLMYKGVYFSHLGIWFCNKCDNARPKPKFNKIFSPLPGLYNEYNTLAAAATVASLGIDKQTIIKVLKDFKPAFGRQEEFDFDGKKIKIFLSKNPAGFNASLRTVLELKPQVILFVLNDRIPDGRDVSWIWDADFETIPEHIKIVVSGDRLFDLGLRIKYASKNQKDEKESIIIENLKEAINQGLHLVKPGETLYILPTYSAMLEVRKILTGRKIL